MNNIPLRFITSNLPSVRYPATHSFMQLIASEICRLDNKIAFIFPLKEIHVSPSGFPIHPLPSTFAIQLPNTSEVCLLAGSHLGAMYRLVRLITNIMKIKMITVIMTDLIVISNGIACGCMLKMQVASAMG